LCNAKGGDDLLWRFHEDPITFLPTFKYDKNSDVYDTSKKQRTPSFTDRILVSLNEGKAQNDFQIEAPDVLRPNGNSLLVDYYNRRESKFSDHRPVLGIFKLTVRKVDKAKLGKLRGDILAEIGVKTSHLAPPR